jgi:K(+)-stimulated pyrophosphate-energized sodium pump
MNPMQPINVGFMTSALIASLGFAVVAWFVFGSMDLSLIPVGVDQKLMHILQNFWWLSFLATFVGIVLTQVIGKITEYFTSAELKPVTEIAASARTGPATLILAGLSEGLESSVWAVLAIAATIYGAYVLFPNPAFAAYAISLAGLGLLATTGYVLAMDTYGPISDNANGIFEMSGALKNADGTENKAAHNIVSRLDMVGNTTKALTKGFAIATAVIAAVSLYRSFLDTVGGAQVVAGIVTNGVADILVKNIQVNLPDVFIGLLIGGAVPFLFSSFAIRAVSRAAIQLVEEVRHQFKTIPGIWEYTGVGEKGKPDYARCVAISTAAAQKELLGPGLLAVFSPILVGFWLGPYALGGFLAGCILVGQLMAVFMSNTGGAWDNAKKKIEDGYLGGKGSEAHKAGVIGDTVGDPLKDTAGPALNPMIKVMNLISILVAPSTVQLADSPWKWAVVLVALAILAGAVMFSKRGGVIVEAGSSSAVQKQP